MPHFTKSRNPGVVTANSPLKVQHPHGQRQRGSVLAKPRGGGVFFGVFFSAIQGAEAGNFVLGVATAEEG